MCPLPRSRYRCLGLVVALALGWAAALPAAGLDSALTAADLDLAQCTELPPNPRTEPFSVTDQSLPAFLRLAGAAPPHTVWRTGEDSAAPQYFRLAFTRPLTIGTIIAVTAGSFSTLRPEATYPGRLDAEADWAPLSDPHPAGDLRVLALPQLLATRALRVSFASPSPGTAPRRAEIAGLRLLRGRYANLAWGAVALADSEAADNDREREAFGRQGLNDGVVGGDAGGEWRHRPGAPLTEAAPAWAALRWDAPQAIVAVGFVNAFAKTLAVDTYGGPGEVHPLAAPASAWQERGRADVPIWWRPAYTDFLLDLGQPPRTTCVRVRCTAALTTENPDIAYQSQQQPLQARLGELLALCDLGAAPVAIALPAGRTGGFAARLSTTCGQPAVPAPAAVVVDGELPEWDTSGGIFICPDTQLLLTRASAWAYVMYDQDALYVALDVNDPTPLGNAHDPESEPALGWGGDGVQVRLQTDRVTHLTTWYAKARQRAVVHVAYGADFAGGEIANAALTGEAAVAFRERPDHSGYVEELRLPWRLITQDGKPRLAGQTLALHYDLKWGTRDQPETSFADNLATPATSREGTWRDPAAWGQVRLLASGFLDWVLPPWLTPAARSAGEQPVSIPYRVPESPTGGPDRELTLVINDAAGRRVRNLVSSVARSTGDNAEAWDGLDDLGNPVPPGSYAWQAIARQALHLRYQFTVNHAGNPPWLAGSTGGWLSDHAAPQAACAIGDKVFIGASTAENGHTLLALDLDGNKLWGTKWLNLAGAQVLASDGTAVYVGSDGGWIQAKLQINRVDPETYAFRNVIEVSFAKTEELPGLVGLAVGGGKAYLALRQPGLIAVYALPPDGPEKGQRVGELALPAPGGLAFDTHGDLWAVSGRTVVRFRQGAGTPETVVTEGLEQPRQLAFAATGQLYVSDGPPAHQVRVFSVAGKALGVVGKPGGRRVGAYAPLGLDEPTGLAVDARGRLWVSETSRQPKRVSLWTPAGELLRTFHGPTRYGGSGYLDATDRTRLHDDGMTFALDWEQGTWRLTDIHYQFQGAPGMTFLRTPGRSWQYQGRTFLANYDYWTSRYLVLYERLADGRIQPLASAGAADFEVGHTTTGVALWGEERFAAARAGRDPKQLNYLWSDLNHDGEQQPDEVQFFQTAAGGVAHWPWGALWSMWITADCGFVVSAQGNGPRQYAWKLPVTAWRDNGAPVYDPTHPVLIADVPRRRVPVYGDVVQSVLADAQGRAILIANPITGCDAAGAPLWTWENPWPGVHGSHSAPSSQPGLVIGGMLAIGTATLDRDLGEVFAITGNKGQVYLFTSDGLLVASLFRDCRAGQPWNFPTAVRGQLLDEVTLGEEHFGGHFTRSSDGKFYLVVGSNHSSLVEIEGLDSLQRLSGAVEMTPALALRCAAAARERAYEQAQRDTPKTTTLRPLVAAPVVDGQLDDWAGREFVEWEAAGGRCRAALARGRDQLFLAFEVRDASPLLNRGSDWRLLFKTGDAVDLHLGTDASADPERRGPVPGDLRLLLTAQRTGANLTPVAVLYRHRVPNTPAAARTAFSSPWRTEWIDQVTRLDPLTAATRVNPAGDGYTVEAAIPLAALGLLPQPGTRLRADLGVLFGDAAGETTIERSYWSNRAVNFTSDVPGEAMLYPNFWGTLQVTEP
jgi:sugar lactone lactonase YvrE